MASNIFPGVYYIQTPGGLYVTHPEPGHVDLVTTTPDQSAAQQWFIAENGVIMSLVDVPTGFAFAYDGAPKGDVMIAKVVTHWTIKAKPEPVKLIGTVGNGVTFWGLEKVVVNDKPIEKVNISTHAKPRRSL